MKTLLNRIEGLKNDGIKDIIERRISEFESFRKKPSKEVFKEYCFCVLTANFDAEKGIKIQKEIGNGFLTLSEKQLARKLKKLGYRFPNMRAKFIAEGRKYKDNLKSIIDSFENESELREWLVRNMKGLGYKEASHFLRNISCKNLAIIDFHIIDLLERHGLIKRPKTVTKKKYFEIEGLLERIAGKSGLSLAELDLYLWYLETGKVLK